MYKTVRHGENSLQYTILPQDGDEESGKSGGQGKSGGGGGGGGSGKGGGGGSRGGGGGGGRGCCRPRTALFLVLTALLVGVVTASVAVPLLLTTDLLSLPGAAFPFSEHRPQIQTRPHQYQHHPAYNATAFHRHPAATTTATTTAGTTTATNSPPTVAAETTTPLSSTTKPAPEPVSGESDIPAAPGPPQEGQREETQSTTASVPGLATQKGKGAAGEDDDDDDDDEDEDEEEEEDNAAPVAVPVEQDDRVDDEDDDEGEGPSADGPAMHTASTEAVRGGDAAGYLAAPAAPSPPAGNDTRNSIWVMPPRNSTRKEGYQIGEGYGSTPDVVVASTDSHVVSTTSTIEPQMPLITATTPPRPITFPTAPTEGTKAGKHATWQGPRWLFTDPSSYLQWTGYNRDGLLLPIILGTVVIVVPATIAICFLIIRRRRRQKDLRRETIGKIASDLQYGDKATLLADASEEE